MALAHLPNVVTSGLVFYYDMNNTQKSWKGAPTTNLITNPLPDGTASNFANAGGTGTLTYDTPTQAIKWVKTAYEVWGTYLYFNPQFNGNLSITDSYTIAFEWKTENLAVPDTSYIYQLVQGNGQSAAASANMLSNSVLQENGWYLFKYTFTPANTGVSAYNRVIVGPQSTNISTFYIRKIQFEQLNFASPFVNGTRSNTQAILDLMNNNSITANSLTYASDGTFSFNGTSDYVDVGSISTLLGTNITVTAVAKISAVVSKNALFSINGAYSFFLPGNRLTTTNQLYWDGVSGWKGGNTTTWSINQWYHFSWVILGTTLTFYVNGLADGTTALAANISPLGASRIGFANGGEYATGTIPHVQIYSKALSSQEIQQNFNAVRRRYGI